MWWRRRAEWRARSSISGRWVFLRSSMWGRREVPIWHRSGTFWGPEWCFRTCWMLLNWSRRGDASSHRSRRRSMSSYCCIVTIRWRTGRISSRSSNSNRKVGRGLLCKRLRGIPRGLLIEFQRQLRGTCQWPLISLNSHLEAMCFQRKFRLIHLQTISSILLMQGLLPQQSLIKWGLKG